MPKPSFANTDVVLNKPTGQEAGLGGQSFAPDSFAPTQFGNQAAVRQSDEVKGFASTFGGEGYAMASPSTQAYGAARHDEGSFALAQGVMAPVNE